MSGVQTVRNETPKELVGLGRESRGALSKAEVAPVRIEDGSVQWEGGEGQSFQLEEPRKSCWRIPVGRDEEMGT